MEVERGPVEGPGRQERHFKVVVHQESGLWDPGRSWGLSRPTAQPQVADSSISSREQQRTRRPAGARDSTTSRGP